MGAGWSGERRWQIREPRKTAANHAGRQKQKHEAGNDRSTALARPRIPIPASLSDATWQAGPRLSRPQEGNFRSRLFLARPRMQDRQSPEIASRLLASQARSEYRPRSEEDRCDTCVRLGNAYGLAVRAGRQGRSTGALSEISRKTDRHEHFMPLDRTRREMCALWKNDR